MGDRPADFERDKWTERRAGIEMSAACPFKPAAGLCKAQCHEQRGEADENERNRGPVADLGRDLRRQYEDRTADHLVDANRGEVPLAEFAPQLYLCNRGGGWREGCAGHNRRC